MSRPGVYALEPDGRVVRVHVREEDDYALEDIAERFQLGRILRSSEDDATVLELSARELRELEVLADAYSFDYDPGFIELCLALARYGAGRAAARVRFRDALCAPPAGKT